MDENKIRKGFYCYEDSQVRAPTRQPLAHLAHLWVLSQAF